MFLNWGFCLSSRCWLTTWHHCCQGLIKLYFDYVAAVIQLPYLVEIIGWCARRSTPSLSKSAPESLHLFLCRCVHSVLEMAYLQAWRQGLGCHGNGIAKQEGGGGVEGGGLFSLFQSTRRGSFLVTVVDKDSCESSLRLGAEPTHSSSSSSDFSSLLFPLFLFFFLCPSFFFAFPFHTPPRHLHHQHLPFPSHTVSVQ